MNECSPVAPVALQTAFTGKRVWLSGHTGFKGSWLAHWLLELGAKVHGFALPPHTEPALFNQLCLAGRVSHEIGNLCDAAAVARSIEQVQPDFVFHLGALAIVRDSFEQPVETYATNVLGTVHVLEALRRLNKHCSAVFVTSDKCYENREWLHAYREEDPVGGYDPYSSSKGAAEIAVASWRRSFFTRHSVRFASARAGNVIGGGDWAKDRIIPDCIRALKKGEPIGVRNKIARRPWQHVLEPLSGYLWLAAVLSRPELRPYDAKLFLSAFNFGPNLDSNRTVAELAGEVLRHWPGSWEDQSDPNAVHEAKMLNLCTDKAFHLLGWKPVWNFEKSVAATIDWYAQSGDPIAFTSRQIAEYQADAARSALPWAAQC